MNRYADIDALLRSTCEAFGEVLRATLDGDPHGARAVLDGSDRRGALVRDAQEALRARTWVPAPQLGTELGLVAAIAQVGVLVDQLAAHVATGEGRTPSPSLRLEVSVLLDSGQRRFRHLLDGPFRPGCTSADLGCTAALFEVVDHAAGDRSPTSALCGSLAGALLQLSRQAAAA